MIEIGPNLAEAIELSVLFLSIAVLFWKLIQKE